MSREQSASPLIRDADAPRNLEVFLVSAIATIIITRVYLILTGYPQIGGGTLHIAHMLWGGLLMLASLIAMISYLNFPLRLTGSLIGGIGFGLFIDEVGKFVTADNNYFFQPTFAILYVLFVGLFLVLRTLFWAVPLTEEEQEVNSQIRSISSLHASRKRALVRVFLELESRVRAAYIEVAGKPRFRGVLITAFVALGLFHGVAAVTSFVTRDHDANWIDMIYMASTAISGLLVLFGAVRLKFHRLQALRLLRMSVLVSLAVSQVFLFYVNELAAMWGLLFDLAAYAALNTMIELDKSSQ